jgi:hypothetical protein
VGSAVPRLGNAQYQAGGGVAPLLGLAEQVPMFQVNLNNYKYHANPVLRGGEAGEWDERGIERVVVLRVAKKDWRMWFGGHGADGSLRIGLATSADGIHWTKHRSNPVLPATEEWEGRKISPTSVVHANGQFYLYYWGPGHVTPIRQKRIGLAVSVDGVSWTKKGVVLEAEPPVLNEGSATNGTGVDAAKVFFMREERRWYMIFTGFGPDGVWNGLAESEDGIHWKKRKAPLVASGGLHNTVGGGWVRGQTLRCPMQIGSIWVGLGYLVGDGACVPAVAQSLDEWVALPGRVLYPNQEYENALAPWSVELADDAFFIYYVHLRAGPGRAGLPALGLIRAPRNTKRQPMVLWEKKEITGEPAQSMIIEPDGRGLAFHVTASQGGEARIEAWNPPEQAWMALASQPVRPGEICTISGAAAHAKVRLRFASAAFPATVSAWAVSE